MPTVLQQRHGQALRDAQLAAARFQIGVLGRQRMNTPAMRLIFRLAGAAGASVVNHQPHGALGMQHAPDLLHENDRGVDIRLCRRLVPQRSKERTQFCSWKVTQRARMVVWPIGRNSRYSVRSEATIPLFDRKNHSSAPTWVLQDMTSGGGQRWPSGHRALARRAASLRAV